MSETRAGLRPPLFAPPAPLELDEEERERIADTVCQYYRDGIEERTRWQARHELYDNMYRGTIERDRTGPWPGSANLHVQMPYWLVDSINTRLTSGVWNQTPLVGGRAEEDDDTELFYQISHLVDWHLQPNRMNARKAWARISRIRCIHGFGVGLLTYVTHRHSYRIVRPQGPPQIRTNDDGTPQLDAEGRLAIERDDAFDEEYLTTYDGPVLHPVSWDDVIAPNDGMNLQPLTPANPGGSDWVLLRSWEPLTHIKQQTDSHYTYWDEYGDDAWWIGQAPAQDRSGSAVTADNQRRVRMQDRFEGRTRAQTNRRSPTHRPNPEFEVITAFMSWTQGNETHEMVFFVATQPKRLIGAFRLTDLNFRARRPLLELHYVPVDTRLYSMGVMEIAQHLSAELDTIHNMRLDVGFATNMPFFFYRASSAIDPEKIELKPLKGVPVDDVNDVRFPQLQNVTSFYEREEQLLYTLVERVLGVTDLFLGVSPTRGAAARHATGFVGTQQEALARTSEILTQDSDAFSFLCHYIYELELQFGPEERTIRLSGKEGPLSQQLDKRQLLLRGLYDFRLGANAGTMSSFLRQEQAQALLQLAQTSPLMAQDPGKLWEAQAFFLQAIGIQDIERFIGPKEAIAPIVSTSPEEENGEMDQQVHGLDQPAPIHPNNDDAAHIRTHLAHLNSGAYQALGRPNQAGHVAHLGLHQQQIRQKQAAQMQAMAQTGPSGPAQGPSGLNGGGQDRIVPQLLNVDQIGRMGSLSGEPGQNTPFTPPQLGGME